MLRLLSLYSRDFSLEFPRAVRLLLHSSAPIVLRSGRRSPVGLLIWTRGYWRRDRAFDPWTGSEILAVGRYNPSCGNLHQRAPPTLLSAAKVGEL